MSAILLLAASIDGRAIAYGPADVQAHALVRAVVISLFTWRRAKPDDELPGSDRMGCWIDSLPPVVGDRIGSRLWLLTRAKLLKDTPAKAREYAEEALVWMLEDGVATAVDVTAERQESATLAMGVVITRALDDSRLDIRFANVWSLINAI